MAVGGKKVYIGRDHGGGSSSGDSWLGMILSFVVCLILFLSCAVVVAGTLLDLIRYTPDKFGPGEVVVSQEMKFNFGPKSRRGTLSVATLRGEQVLIVGRVERDGWLLPDRDPDRFRKLISGAERSELPVLEHYDMHPYVSYGVRFVIFGGFLVVTGLMCLSCVVTWRER